MKDYKYEYQDTVTIWPKDVYRDTSDDLASYFKTRFPDYEILDFRDPVIDDWYITHGETIHLCQNSDFTRSPRFIVKKKTSKARIIIEVDSDIEFEGKGLVAGTHDLLLADWSLKNNEFSLFSKYFPNTTYFPAKVTIEKD